MAAARREPAIGLEVRVLLRTRTKLFCGDLAEPGALPNTHVCPVCLGLPGALPVLNQQAVELATLAALGLGSTVQERSAFVREHCFSPDLPGGYRVTQHGEPLARGGFLLLPDADAGKPLAVRVRSVHLEADGGESLHDRVPGAVAVDLNRAGVPLLGIVTEPDLRTPAQALAFLARLRQTLQYVGASDCDPERGSLRVDASVALRPAGSGTPATPVGVGGLDTLPGVERALRREIERQEAVPGAGGAVEPERADPRYLPDPDLPPLVVSPEWLKRIRRDLPELPDARAARLAKDYGLDPRQAAALTATRELADYYEAVARRTDPGEAAGWVLGDLLAAASAEGCDPDRFRVRPADLAELIEMLAAGVLSRPAAGRVFARMAETGKPPAQVVGEEGPQP